MSRTAALLIAGAVLAGCGASNNHPAAPPKLPASVATELAARSDQVAAALDQGNSCQALDSANALQQDTIRLINEGRVQGPFKEELSSTVSDLAARITCVPPAKDNGKHKGRDKHKGNGEGD